MAYSSLGNTPMVISHNVRGLNSPEKRSALLRELKKGKSNFVLLQETHFKTHHVPKLTDSTFSRAIHATNDLAKSKGVTILIHKEAPFQLTDQQVDPEGRFVFIKGTYGGIPLTLANVYFPNRAHLTFCRQVIQQLQCFAVGCIVLGGDSNIPLNPLVDKSNSKSSIKYRTLRQIKTLYS